MNLRTLYVSKLAKCPLTCLADLAGDLGVRVDGPMAQYSTQKWTRMVMASMAMVGS